MKEPEIPYKSGNYIRCPEYEAKLLIYKLYVHPDFIDEMKENSEEDKKDWEATHTTPWVERQIEEWRYNTDIISLKDILDAAPKDANPEDIVIVIQRDRHINNINVVIELRKPADKEAWQAEKAAEEIEYQKRRAQYDKDKADYDEWLLKEEIKERQEKLANLKK